jgi:beta-hydroxylase
MSSETLSPSHQTRHLARADEHGQAIRVPAPANQNKQTVRERGRAAIMRNATWLVRIADKYFTTQSTVPNSPVLDTTLFPWVAELENNWQVVQAELAAVMRSYDKLPRFQDISPDQGRISPDDDWRTFFFYGFGIRSEPNCKFCPVTSRLLDQVPGIQTAFFSILAPGKIVPPHNGITKALIRAHLGLIVPPPPAECYMDVDDVRCTWQPGQVLVFDDTYRHAVSNSGDQIRVVLLFDFLRPMKWPGRLLRWILFSIMRHTPYVRDALRNEARWSRTYYS